MLEWICHVRTTYPHWEDSSDTHFTIVRNIFVKVSSGSLKSAVIIHLCRPDLAVRPAVTELGNINVMGVIKSRGGRANW